MKTNSQWGLIYDCNDRARIFPALQLKRFNFPTWTHIIINSTNFHHYQVRTRFWHNRWSGAVLQASNRMTRSNLQKIDKTYSVEGGGGWRKVFFTLSPSYPAKSQKPSKISLSYSFAVEMGHFDMVRWRYDSVCIFSMLGATLKMILWKKADKKCND